MSDLVKRGHDKAAQLKSSGGAVSQLISDLATQLDVQLARSNALAAENAGLKSIQEWAVADVFKTGAKRFESIKAAGFDTDDCLHDVVLVMLSELQTPATDAFLAEVRAQGVDSAINTVIAMMNHQHPVTSKAIDILRTHAYQVRKGVQS
ncbi:MULTISPECIES: hypothetical protein [Enterobacter cloacae complex]|uniref:hypothetical protein n=1 Tax=Enterobacter cloacae complex TaxID=354276 RepID=UPI0021020862|nr:MULTISPECIES: hypothetical protein [Enterobacter cloacae complex]MCW4734450.1 hypothetical protein [Enterobacter hormaechei subsp. xiangfangensis]MDQ6582954.1 hypothetical protein [Enterobacter hormaechei]MDQ6593732.1 hypothetical protein [Enterobacter hormaechei]